MIVSANTISYFIPTITVVLGYTGRAAQFMTVPIHASAVVAILIVTLSADYFKETTFHVAIPTLISGIMYAICIKLTDPSTRYGLLWSAMSGSISSSSTLSSSKTKTDKQIKKQRWLCCHSRFLTSCSRLALERVELSTWKESSLSSDRQHRSISLCPLQIPPKKHSIQADRLRVCFCVITPSWKCGSHLRELSMVRCTWLHGWLRSHDHLLF